MAGWSELPQDLTRLTAHWLVTYNDQVRFNMCLYFMEIFWTGTTRKRKVSLFYVVDDSLALAKKADGSLNGGNNMTSSINKWYEKPYSQRFYEILENRKTLSCMESKGVLKLMNTIIDDAISISGCRHQIFFSK